MGAVVFLTSAAAIAGCAPVHAATSVDGCTAAAVETGGHRALALVIGVGAYKNKTIPQLLGPPNDARAITKLLVERYGFPPQNVCTLLDDKATTAAFESTWQSALVSRARPGDTAVFYFAGHGSQMTDDNGDEPSGMDQTLVFHDARTGQVIDLRDDRVNKLLERLYAKTTNVVVIADSCNSGSVTRGIDAGRAIARVIPPPNRAAPANGFQSGTGKGWVPATLPELVAINAAADGTSALEIDGHGVFTDALIQILNQPATSLSYAQLARQVPGLMSARSPQVPYFQGKLDRSVFGSAALPRPISWEVKRVAGETVELAGTPTPGMGANAELRVFEPGARQEDYGNPTKAKATLVVRSASGFNAKARIAKAARGTKPVATGDLALLVRPGDSTVQVTVRLRPFGEPGGIPKVRAKVLRAAIEKNADAKAAVIPVDGAGTFELAELKDHRLQLRGIANEVRAILKDDDEAVEVLWQLARQQALANLHGEGNPYFQDDESLKVEIVPAAGPGEQGACGARKVSEFVPRRPGESVQTIGLCTAYYVKVTLAPDAARSVIVGGVMLSGDGRTIGFPIDGSMTELKPGQSYSFRERFRAGPPIGVNDVLRVFGTLKTNPVPWHSLTSDWRTRSTRGPTSPLHRALERYLVAGTRGSGLEALREDEDSQWTVSTLTIHVEANQAFGPAATLAAKGGAPDLQNDSIRGFDIRPYLPDDRASALHRVLQVTDHLAKQKVSYKQHAWTAATFEENLKLGIDTSHSMMAAFTQAGLPYNKAGVYLSTADMVASQTAMADYFDRCDDKLPELGDLLVYRDEQRGDGLVMMMIDPQRRIGWGSPGWDGDSKNSKLLKVEPPNGIQFQLIRNREDWKRADHKNATVRACWRYRQFADEARDGRGLPGMDALGQNPCDANRCTAAGSR